MFQSLPPATSLKSARGFSLTQAIAPKLLTLAIAAALGLSGPAFLPVHMVSAHAREVAAPKKIHVVEGITEYRLANGMKVILAPDAANDLVTVNVTYMVGSRHEGYGETGMAHLLEHLIFKGTPKTPDPKVEFQKRGMNWNGTTNQDRTDYFASFKTSQDNLTWYINWQADAMTNSFIAKKDLDSEMTVVRNELEQRENNPVAAMFARMDASAFMWHNYGKSTIGAQSDIEQVDISNLQSFYRRFYRPDNAVILVAGKFDAALTLQTIQAAFGGIAKPPTPVAKTYTVDSTQDGERSAVLRRASPVQFVAASYHVPPALHPDSVPLELLALVLGDQPSGRLHKALVETKEAQAAFASTWGRREAGTFYVGTVLGPNDEAAPRMQKMLDIAENLAKQPVTQEEFDRAKAKMQKSLELAFANAAAVAAGAIQMEVMGDWRSVFVRRDRVAMATLDDVNRVAKTYLLRDNRTTGHLIPTESPARAPKPSLTAAEDYLKGFALKETGETSVEFDFGYDNLKKMAVVGKTPGGVDVSVLNKPVRGDLVTLSMTLKLADLPSLSQIGMEGQFALQTAGSMLKRGTTKLTRQQIDDTIVKLGANVDAGVGAQAGYLNITVKKDKFEETLRFAAHLLKDSTFPDKELQEIRAQAVKGIEGQMADKASQANNRWQRYGNPYTKGDPRYVPTLEESLASIKAVTQADMVALYKRFAGARTALVGVVGPIDPALVQKIVGEEFDGWRADQNYARVPQPLVERTATRLQFDTPDKANASITAWLSIPVIDDNSPESMAVDMAADIFGGGPGSRLWDQLREKSGVSYSAAAYAQLSEFEANGSITVQSDVAPINLAKAEGMIKSELARSLKDGFTQAELDKFKAQTLKQRREGRTGDQFAMSLLKRKLEFKNEPWALGLIRDRVIEELTLDQVNAAWRRHMNPEKLVWGVWVDEAKLK
jgi:zinc protease